MATISGLQLMLVDPDDDLRFLLKTLLELTGCRVETARNAHEAFATMEACPPDVILTDFVLDDVTGLDFGRAIRARPWGQETMLVALTGHYYRGIKGDAWTAGFDRFLLKPVQHDQLQDILASAAKKPGRRRPHLRSNALKEMYLQA